MATGVIVAEANEDLTALAAEFPWIKLHTGDPGASGTANAATNAVRKQAAFAAPSGGAIATNAELQWSSVSTTETYTHWSGWSAETDGAAGWSGTITGGAVTAGNNFVINSGDLDFTYNVMA